MLPRVAWKTARTLNCLAATNGQRDEPVLGEPVSSANSLLAGKMQGIFANLNQIRRMVYG